LSMSSTTLISVEEYVATSYRPDCDYIDGEVRERNLGEIEHAILQSTVLAWFWAKKEEWNILPLVEQRVQISATRFRVPDVTVLGANQPREPIITLPPLILIEVLSKDDTLRSMRERVDDYLNFGVQHVWIVDPAMRRAYVCSRTGFQEPETGELVVPDTPIRLVLHDLFDQAAQAL
jgi:Uma2 family endonuclease